MQYKSTHWRLVCAIIAALALTLTTHAAPRQAHAATVRPLGPCNGCSYAYSLGAPYRGSAVYGYWIYTTVYLPFCGYQSPYMTMVYTGQVSPVHWYGPASGCTTSSFQISFDCNSQINVDYYDQIGDYKIGVIWTPNCPT